MAFYVGGDAPGAFYPLDSVRKLSRLTELMIEAERDPCTRFGKLAIYYLSKPAYEKTIWDSSHFPLMQIAYAQQCLGRSGFSHSLLIVRVPTFIFYLAEEVVHRLEEKVSTPGC